MDTNTRYGNSDWAHSEDPFLRMAAEKPTIHFLREPKSLDSFWLWGNLHYQMQWSVETLEHTLAKEGNPHVLQLNAYSFGKADMDWQNPDIWHLYADGIEVAHGDGNQARRCFEENAETFRNLCRECVESAGLQQLSEREYWLLCRSRDIAKYEPFDRSQHIAGAREGRVQ